MQRLRGDDPRGWLSPRPEPALRAQVSLQACHRSAVNAYNDAVRRPRRLAALEVERAAEIKVLEREHKRRLKAVRREAEAGRRRQDPGGVHRGSSQAGGLYIRTSDEGP